LRLFYVVSLSALFALRPANRDLAPPYGPAVLSRSVKSATEQITFRSHRCSKHVATATAAARPVCVSVCLSVRHGREKYLISVLPTRWRQKSTWNRITSLSPSQYCSRVVSASDCGVRGPCMFESHRGRLCSSRQPLRYTALGTGCAPLLQCLGRFSLPPSVGR